VQAHQGPAATGAARELGAEAYAIGNAVAFTRSPGLHTAAHEAAHVVQQRSGVQLKGDIDQPGDTYECHADAVADAVVAGRSAAPLLDEVSGGRGNRDVAIQRTPATAAAAADTAAQPGMWEHTFGEASTPVGKIGRVQAPKGVYLRERPIPGAKSPSAPVPFNGLVFVERRTNQGSANERWCYVIATELGIAGFCEERYVAIDPPEPTATLHRTAPGERLATIAEQAYGPANDDNNSRLYVQSLCLANRDRAGVQLDPVDLSFKDRALRGEDERRTLQVYKGAKVIAGTSIWIPSKPFIEQLKAAGAVTGGSTLITEAWDAAKGAAGAVVDGAKYVAGFFVGLLEGAYSAIVDLFRGAVDMVEAMLQVVWNVVSGNPGRVKEMASAWVDKMKAVWDHRGEIADEFLKKWNAESAWDRGVFRGEVLGWVTMTVLLILVTMGEGAPAALSGIAVRWPQLIKLLKTVDALGDVTKYLGAAAKVAKPPSKATRFVEGKFGKAERATGHLAGDGQRAVEDVERGASHAAHGEKPLEPHQSAGHHDTVTVHGLAQKPKTYPWTKNPAGVVRTTADVKRIALEHGVEIPGDIQIFAVQGKWLPPDSFAQYMGRDFLPGQRVSWEQFYNRYDNIAVKISKDILDSDEAIVAVMAHEMHELNGLRKIFAERETLPVEELGRMINPGHKGNLHDQAWDVADQLVAKMRKAGQR
jgi:hypothetical protein